MLSNLEKIYYNINKAKQGLGTEIFICAVGKTHPASEVQKAIDAGILNIGENRIQEAEDKFSLLHGARRHLIGPLQSNKENKALSLFDVIQTLESLEQTQRLCAKLERLGVKKSFYIQVNTSGEEQKHGVKDPSEVVRMALELMCCPPAVFEGLMTIGPLEGDPAPSFARLRVLRDKISQEFGIPLGLSMGMSGDYEIAVREGATLLRLGSLLFGKRNY